MVEYERSSVAATAILLVEPCHTIFGTGKPAVDWPQSAHRIARAHSSNDTGRNVVGDDMLAGESPGSSPFGEVMIVSQAALGSSSRRQTQKAFAKRGFSALRYSSTAKLDVMTDRIKFVSRASRSRTTPGEVLQRAAAETA